VERLDDIRIGMITIRERVVIAPIVEKMMETRVRVRWFGYVERKPVNSVVTRLDQMKGSQIATCRGSPRKTIKKKLLRNAWFGPCSRPYLVERCCC
jgi:hypothetical protein